MFRHTVERIAERFPIPFSGLFYHEMFGEILISLLRKPSLPDHRCVSVDEGGGHSAMSWRADLPYALTN